MNYFGLWRYIRSIKPSHLAFNAYLETRTLIQVTTETRYNILGYGLTGQYDCGTRPQTNIIAELPDMEVLIEAEGQPFGIDFRFAGTCPQPNILFEQDGMTTVEPELTATPYIIPYPMTQDGNRSHAGTHPQPNIVGGISDTDVDTDILTQGVVYTFEPTGTKPQPDTQYGTVGDGLQPIIKTKSYSAKYIPCGTKLTGE
jgi:hypothetical protein